KLDVPRLGAQATRGFGAKRTQRLPVNAAAKKIVESLLLRRAAAEFAVERLRALDDGELDGEAVLEVAHHLAAHGAERDLDADSRLDRVRDSRARKRQVDDAAGILAAVEKVEHAHRIARRDALVAAVFRQIQFVLVGEPGELRRELVL